MPKEALLSRFTTISKEGKVSTVGNPKIAYSVMLGIRCNLLKYAFEGMMKFTLISGRYVNLRKQFRSIPGSSEERKLIDYSATKDKLLPSIAFGYAIFFSWKHCSQEAERANKEQLDSDPLIR